MLSLVLMEKFRSRDLPIVDFTSTLDFSRSSCNDASDDASDGQGLALVC
jgi:hypothetical protein